MRKKLFAILMSAMMMVTFMPAMAFADDNYVFVASKFVNNYTQVEGKIGTQKVTLPTTRSLVVSADAATNGMIEVKPDTSGTDYVVSGDPAAYYYDLSGFKMAGDFEFGTIDMSTLESFFKNESNQAVGSQTVTKWLVAAPSYCVNKTAAARINSVQGGYVITAAKPVYDENSFAAQDVTIALTCAYAGTDPITGTTTNPDVMGTLAPKTITINARTATHENAAFYIDEVKASKAIENGVAYDGAEHTVVMNTLPNATVSYKVLKNGRWESVDKVTVKDAGTTTAKAFVKVGATDTEHEKNLTINVTPARGFVYGFDQEVKKTVSNDFDPFDLMTTEFAFSWYEQYSGEKATAADKAAVAANADMLKAYFNDYYEFVKTPAKADENQVTVTIKAKDLSSLTVDEKAALAKKYTQFLANFKTEHMGRYMNETVNVDVDTDSSIVVTVEGGDIEWVKAPLTKKYYNKKGTLAKTYTFAVEAKADAKVTYKLANGGEMIKIDKNTGKVTVKKGLKVGTYKVQITAKAGKTASETYELVIKMAKKK